MKEFQELHSIAARDLKYSEWSQQRTLDEKAQMLLQEVKEMMEAVKKQDMLNLQEELGDIIWDALTITALAEEKGLFTADETLRKVADKIKMRKPWIFTGEKLTAEQESRYWKKAKEKT